MAAGSGVRLGDKTKESPKTLLKVNGRPIASYILEGFSHFSYPLTVITGFFSEKLISFFQETDPHIQCLYNPDYKEGNLKSLLCAEQHMDDGFIVFNADHVYSLDILKKIFTPKKSITAFCDFDRPLCADDMKVTHRNQKTAHFFSKALFQDRGGYVGVTQVPKNKALLYKKAALGCLEKHGPKINVEQVLNELIEQGEKIDIVDVSGSVWFEVDTAEDLKKAHTLAHKLVN